MHTSCSCGCGKSNFDLTGKPVVRFVCHCDICKKVYNKPYADIIAMKLNDIKLPYDYSINFAKHRLPPNVNRGVCCHCQAPVFATMPIIPRLFGMAFIPTANFGDDVALPEISLHSFYDRRVADVDDYLPKYEGYVASQLAVGKGFMLNLFK